MNTTAFDKTLGEPSCEIRFKNATDFLTSENRNLNMPRSVCKTTNGDFTSTRMISCLYNENVKDDKPSLLF